MKNFGVTLFAVVLETLATLITWVPKPLRRPLVKGLGHLYAIFAWPQKKSLRINLKRILGLEGGELKKTIKEILINFSLTLYDFFFPDNVVLNVSNRSILDEFRKKNQGVLLLTFHMGCWELGARTMRDWNWPVTAVIQPYANRKFKQVIEKRRPKGVNFLSVGKDAAPGVIKALKRGDMVAMLGDHPFGETGIPVSLLGSQVRWPKGPIVLALRAKAPIVPVVITRTSETTYQACIEEPLHAVKQGKETVGELTQAVANKFGELLKKYPTQWYRFRPFDYVENSG